ncbi:hypothetical protein Tco_0559234 [Tanacetum coccineum]
MKSHPGYLSAAIIFWGCDRLVSRALVIENCRYLDHVFDFPADDPTHDFEDSNMEPEEDPEEEPEEDPEEVIPHVIAAPPKSLITPPPLLESSSDSKFTTPVTYNETFWVPPPGSTFEVEGPSSVSAPPPYLLGHKVKRLRKDRSL